MISFKVIQLIYCLPDQLGDIKMVFQQKTPIGIPHRVIYKGDVTEGEGQYPIKKTEDWVENLGTFDQKLWKSFKVGFCTSAAFAISDIR